MSKFREGMHVIAEVPGVVDSDGEVALAPGSWIIPEDFDKYKVRLVPVEIRQGAIYKDAAGNNYIGTGEGHVHDGARYLGPSGAGPVPTDLVEVQA